MNIERSLGLLLLAMAVAAVAVLSAIYLMFS
jgi:hypothetical protein